MREIIIAVIPRDWQGKNVQEMKAISAVERNGAASWDYHYPQMVHLLSLNDLQELCSITHMALPDKNQIIIIIPYYLIVATLYCM